MQSSGLRCAAHLNLALEPMKAILFSAIAAIAVQPIVFVVLYILLSLILGADIPTKELLSTPLFAALFSVPFVVVIGIPSVLLLRYFNRLSWLSLGAVGFIFAALPIAIYGWSEYPGYSSGGNWYGKPVGFVVDGQKTFYGWLSYAQNILFFALHGLAGALMFFFVCRRGLGPNKSLQPTPLRGSAELNR